MSDLHQVKAWIDEALPDLARRHDVPGAAVGVLAHGEVIDAATGLLSLATGVEVTTDSVFQIGSTTKLWTATLVMQLVDEGLLDLDEPVRRHLPGFRIADESAAASITARQLLSHTAGFEGDIFTDTGKGDDCLEKYVDTLGDTPQLFPPGERFSYNNAGYCVLGRRVEVLRGKPFDDCLRERLFTPLGLTHAANGPYEAIMFRAAVGHIRPTPDADPVPAPVWALARSNAPAGSMLAMRPRDLLAFAAMHMEGGRGPDGTAVLSPEAVERMYTPAVELPRLGLLGDTWGLGPELYHTPDGLLAGHDGNTIGQACFLRFAPDTGVAVAIMANGGDTFALFREISGHVFQELAGMTVAPLPAPPASPQRIDASRYVGTYSTQVADMIVSQDADGRIWIDQIPKGIFVELGGKPEHNELVYYEDDSLIPLKGDRGMHIPHAFVGDDGTGRALYLHVGRAIRRADTSPASAEPARG
ncbi:MAG: serine hydrolase domain-containing protein [Candidatus Limnocylindrales bacterium]